MMACCYPPLVTALPFFSSHTKLALAVSLVCALWGAASASAQQDARPSPAARRAFEQGSEHYEQGRYVEAADAFEQAYELSGAPDVLYNVYTAAQRANDPPRAAHALERYLRLGEIARGERAMLETRLVRLREEITAQAAAEERERTAAQAEAERVAEVERRAAEAEAAVGQQRLSTGALVSFVVGGVGLVSAGLFAGLSAYENNRVAGLCGSRAGRVCTDEQVQSLRIFNFFADFALGVAVLGATTGIILYLVQRPSDDEEEDAEAARVQIAPIVGPAWGLQAGGRF